MFGSEFFSDDMSKDYKTSLSSINKTIIGQCIQSSKFSEPTKTNIKGKTYKTKTAKLDWNPIIPLQRVEVPPECLRFE